MEQCSFSSGQQIISRDFVCRNFDQCRSIRNWLEHKEGTKNGNEDNLSLQS